MNALWCGPTADTYSEGSALLALLLIPGLVATSVGYWDDSIYNDAMMRCNGVREHSIHVQQQGDFNITATL